MPLKLIEPRQGRSPNYRVRGTHLGITIDRTTGSSDKATARKILARWKAEIERGEFAGRKELTFAAAALAYVQAGGEGRFVLAVANYFGDKVLARHIGQIEADGCADTLYPNATPATRNRQVYTPISAVLKRSGIETKIRRPIGANGKKRTDWMTPAEAEALISSALNVDYEFGIFLAVLLGTGMRLSDCLSLECRQVDLGRSFAYVGKTKNGQPRPVHLPPSAVAALANHPNGLGRQGRVFRFNKNGYLYNLMKVAKKPVGLEWVTFHIFCHTWATWMRQYGGLDTLDLVATGRWNDLSSASRYAHVETSAISRQADLLPIKWTGKKR